MRLSIACALLMSGAATCGSGGDKQPTAAKPQALDAARAPDYGAGFGAHWYDGRAELAGYELRYPRYGSVRDGTAVAIFVTEPQLLATRVKPDDPERGDFTALKLNLVQDFSTGIYDYNLMTSAFVALSPVEHRPAGSASKVSFSAQEWCGQVYAQLLFQADRAELASHSYFESEADERRALQLPATTLSEDALWLWARRLAWPRLAPGETLEVAVLGSLEHTRTQHKPLGVGRAQLSFDAHTQRRHVPAGEFEVDVLHASLERSDGSHVDYEFAIEHAEPHRVVEVTRDDGYRARLTGSMRTAYWQQNHPGDEALLQQLGLHRRPARTP